MAKNDLDADIANKIIIVDDPMSSLDQSRQRATQIALVDLARKSNQLILLSHDPVFLQAFIENGDYDINSVNIYEFKRAQNDYSTLEECNIEECIQSVYKRNYQTVSKRISKNIPQNHSTISEYNQGRVWKISSILPWRNGTRASNNLVIG
jgi:wobble nucleotide-excising tRNase